ncbi:hypothetical protein R1sor_001009 [Riccia sorocarpa]|uniref:Uncharacterized protein n=1 Tax=Riccia sorocarpa TaxID=122646 RepID=A0ABD3GXW6_9MARC
MEPIIREPKPGGAITNIIHNVTWDFGDLPTPKIPLCRLVPFCRVRQFQTSSIQTEALKKSFETQCYMEHASAFHVSPFDENGEAMFVKQEDKDKWDTLWRMESDAFDAEMLKEPAYKELVNRMFSTWDGNHRVITWTQVSRSREKTNKRAWHPRVRCVIICPPVHVYKAIEVAMHNLNASSHATVQYDWIQDAERCRQVLSTPLNAYKAMIGDDVYEEFEKSRLKAPPNKAWYNENMTADAASYILSYAEVTTAKDLQPDVEAEEEKRLGKSLSTKQKKDLWDAKVKEVCASWQHVVFKYATIVNPQLGPEFLETLRELHDQLAKIEKSKREISYSVGVDCVKAFASAGIHNALKLELLRAHYDAETLCWEKIQKEEEPFDVSKDKFEDSDKKGQLEEARHLEPSPNIDGLVVNTSRTKKQKESKMKKSKDVEDEEGQTPKGKPKPGKNPGSGRSSRTKKGKEKEETPKETPKETLKDRRKKKDQSDDEAVQVSQEQPTSNDPGVQPDSATPTVEEQPEPATAREEGRQRKRAKKLANGLRLYEGFFRADQFLDIPNQFAVLKTFLKSTSTSFMQTRGAPKNSQFRSSTN